jgi:hypothetical protein
MFDNERFVMVLTLDLKHALNRLRWLVPLMI